MRLWDSFRTAFQLAARVEECESRLNSMEYEWTDIQEKLLAREERLRKRLSRELKASLGESPPSLSPVPEEGMLTLPAGSQAAKRAITAQFRRTVQAQKEG